jgi:hypothetical protein
MKGEFNYFSFYLPTIENVTAIEFFTTIIQGDVSILVSTTIKYPTMEDMFNNGDVEFGALTSVIMKGKKLKVGTYYIGVYGFAITDYTIGVAL